MTRLHLHISVDDLDQSIRFYQTLFGAAPTLVEPDYAKWSLDDPSVNFAISALGCGKAGIEHVGIETGNRTELDTITARLHAAEEGTFQEEATTCCYAVSDKTWVEDPSGVRWETFHTTEKATEYGVDASLGAEIKPTPPRHSGCC
ncbi:MAG: ArsI/CadI family heavy metal resistance metalloenzyme [Pseudomonadota bacterium]